MAEQRTYVLGGETRRRALFTGMSPGLLISGGIYVAAWMALLLISRSVLVLAGGAVLGFVGLSFARRRTDVGDLWAGSMRARVSYVVGRRRRQEAPEFVPGVCLPAEVGEIRVLSYAPPSAPSAPMAIIHHRDMARGWATGHLSAVFEIVGSGDGLLPTRTVNTAGLLFERLLGGLASAEIPVSQLDVATRVLPVQPTAYAREMAAMVRPGTSELLRASMEELAGYAAWNTEEYRSWVTVRIPLAQLTAAMPSTAGSRDLDAVCAATFDTVGEVTRRLSSAGLPLRAVLGPRRLGALIRHLHDPDMDIEDLEGITGVVDGWAGPRWSEPDHARVRGTYRDWYHAVASVPRDAWPAQPVSARWMEHLVTRVNPATIRTIQTQFKLIPKTRARDIARVGLTYDVADAAGARRKGQVSTGEVEASLSASRRVLHDLLQPVVAGVYPTVRVMVSSPDLGDLTAARRRITAASEDAGITRLRWADYRHARALMTTLPLARGIA